jgi:hypothetical protein
LGPVHAIPLAEARKRAAECRRMRVDCINRRKAAPDFGRKRQVISAQSGT